MRPNGTFTTELPIDPHSLTALHSQDEHPESCGSLGRIMKHSSWH